MPLNCLTMRLGGLFIIEKPYKQMSRKQAKKDNKVSPKYYGSYKVLQKIGTMAYKLELPAASRVHPIFHVSCLKKVIGDKLAVQIILLELDEEGKIIVDSEADALWLWGFSIP